GAGTTTRGGAVTVGGRRATRVPEPRGSAWPVINRRSGHRARRRRGRSCCCRSRWGLPRIVQDVQGGGRGGRGHGEELGGLAVKRESPLIESRAVRREVIDADRVGVTAREGEDVCASSGEDAGEASSHELP